MNETIQQQRAIYPPRVPATTPAEVEGDFTKLSGPDRDWCVGSPTPPDKYLKRFIKRFWSKVNTEPGQGPQGECWEFIGSRTGRPGKQYGQLSYRMQDGSKRPIRAHVAAWTIVYGHGPVPKGWHVCHKCNNPPCVREKHLFPGTPAQNVHHAQATGLMPIRQPKSERARKIWLTPDQCKTLIDARRERGYGQSDLARMIGIDTTHYCRFERGNLNRKIRYEHFIAILGVLGLTLEEVRVENSQISEHGSAELSMPTRALYVKFDRGRRPGDQSKAGEFSALPPPNLQHYRADILRLYFQRSRKTIMAVRREAKVGMWTVKGALMGDPIKQAGLEKICAAIGLQIELAHEMLATAA